MYCLTRRCGLLYAMRRWLLGIHARMLLLVVAASLPLIALLAFNAREKLSWERANTQAQARERARLSAAAIDSELERIETLLLYLSKGIIFDPAEAERNISLLQEVRRDLPDLYGNFEVHGLDGRPGQCSPGAQPVGQRAYFRATISRNKFTLSDLEQIQAGGPWIVTASCPIHNKDGQTTGALSISMDLTLWSKRLNASDLPPESLISVTNPALMNLLRSTEPEKIGTLSGDEDAVRTATRNRQGSIEFATKKGKVRLAGYTTCRSAPWLVMVRVSGALAYAEANRQLRQTGLIIALALAVCFALAWLIANQLANPIRQLAADSTALAAGQRPPLAGADSQSELGTLTRAFRQMAAAVAERDVAVRESERRYRTLIEWLPDAVMVCRNARVAYLNPAAASLFGADGPERLLGLSVLELFHPDSHDWVQQQLKEQPGSGQTPSAPMEVKFQLLDGTTIDAESQTIRISYAGETAVQFIARDIRRRKLADRERDQLQLQLTQSHKMESVGRLAGGIAHDFNNMLTAIQGNVTLALEELSPHSPARENLEQIQICAQRSADLTRQLLAFARRQNIVPKVLDLNATVEGMLKILRRIIGENIELEWRPGAEVWPLRIDPSQIDQMLTNLCVNSRDAISEFGHVTIETGCASFTAAEIALQPEVAPGDYVYLKVMDNGCGMDQETLGHLFEPFFTTKDLGQGTGLGLATVYGIVRQNQGFIRVRSVSGEGAVFQIFLPRHQAVPGVADSGNPFAPPASGRETILLVEDEPLILRVAQLMLQNLGYTVLAADGPGEAIRLAQEHVGEINLVLTDVIMPGMNGRELVKRLQVLRPNLRRIFMSGYAANVLTGEDEGPGKVLFIAKPFAKDVLAATVRAALDEPLAAT